LICSSELSWVIHPRHSKNLCRPLIDKASCKLCTRGKTSGGLLVRKTIPSGSFYMGMLTTRIFLTTDGVTDLLSAMTLPEVPRAEKHGKHITPTTMNVTLAQLAA